MKDPTRYRPHTPGPPPCGGVPGVSPYRQGAGVARYSVSSSRTGNPVFPWRDSGCFYTAGPGPQVIGGPKPNIEADQ